MKTKLTIFFIRNKKSWSNIREFFHPYLGRFPNNQKYLLSLSSQDVKYSSTQYIDPGSKVWRISAFCYDLNLGMIFWLNQDFTDSGVVLGATPHTHHSLAWKILVSIKNHSWLCFTTEGRYIASRENIQGENVLFLALLHSFYISFKFRNYIIRSSVDKFLA